MEILTSFKDIQENQIHCHDLVQYLDPRKQPPSILVELTKVYGCTVTNESPILFSLNITARDISSGTSHSPENLS